VYLLERGKKVTVQMKLMMGGETEYALSATYARGKVVDQPSLLRRFIEYSKQSLPYTSVSGWGRFLENGGFLYLDSGLHIEWATPECTSPFDVTRFLRAGDKIVNDLATQLLQDSPDLADIFCSRCNVDYVDRTLWAAHESYMHHADPHDLPDQLIPFLASRVVLGAGGWDYQSPGLCFTLSPRAHFISQVVGHDSQHVRPLFHTKNESLSGTGSHRLHVACSETSCSDIATVLRFGTTALVVAIVELGARPGADVALASPLTALRRFARDVKCRVQATTTHGRRVTALDIQRHYLSCVEQYLGSSQLPEWAQEVCGLWKSTLDKVDAGLSQVDRTLDWAVKRRLFARWLDRKGIAWASLRTWNAAIRQLRRTWKSDGPKDQPFDLKRVIQGDAVFGPTMRRLTPYLTDRGLAWGQLAALAEARSELFELDARFGGLGERGIFRALDAAGALRHRIETLDLATALKTPPPDTRARVRGEVVQRLTQAGTKYRAEWTGIYDISHRRELDLRNPFETEERWTEVTSESLAGRLANVFGHYGP
jgi:proteasome accessory factor A